MSKSRAFNVSHRHQTKPSEIDLRVHFNSMLWVAHIRCSISDRSKCETLSSIRIPCQLWSLSSVSHRRCPAGEHCFGYFFSSRIFSLVAYDAGIAGKNTINWNKLPSAMTTASTSVDERECQAIENFHIHEISADDDDNDVIYRGKNRVFWNRINDIRSYHPVVCPHTTPILADFLNFTLW